MVNHLPNILVTGTPGCGKTTFADELSRTCSEKGYNFDHVNVSELVKSKTLHFGYNEEFDTYMLDEDKLCDELEDCMKRGGQIIDFHSCDFFPERWFDLVLVLQTRTEILFDRLEKRGYSEKKRNENMECEIMQVVLDEAMESYDENIVIALESNTVDDMESNIERTMTWIDRFLDKS